jgi:hypothetical protein
LDRRHHQICITDLGTLPFFTPPWEGHRTAPIHRSTQWDYPMAILKSH